MIMKLCTVYKSKNASVSRREWSSHSPKKWNCVVIEVLEQNHIFRMWSNIAVYGKEKYSVKSLIKYRKLLLGR